MDTNADPLLGKNPFSLSGDEWKEKRSEITPAFTAVRVSIYNEYSFHSNNKMSNKQIKKIAG